MTPERASTLAITAGLGLGVLAVGVAVSGLIWALFFSGA